LGSLKRNQLPAALAVGKGIKEEELKREKI
jgi:hypothetical protein